MFRSLPFSIAILTALSGCAFIPEGKISPDTPIPPDKAVVVQGVLCGQGNGVSCSVEIKKLIGDDFSFAESTRLVSSASGSIQGDGKDKKANGSYFAYVVDPGEYAISKYSITIPGYRTHISNYILADKDTKKPYTRIKIEAGKINYLGDFLIFPTALKQNERFIRIINEKSAKTFMARYPNATGEFVIREIGIERIPEVAPTPDKAE